MNQLPAILTALAAGLLLAACGGSGETRSDRTGSSVDRVSPVRAAELNTRLGIGYLERGDTQQALEKLKRAVSQDPEHVPAHMGLGIIYRQIGETDKALDHLQRAVRLAPEDGAAHNSYATLLCRTRKFDQADQHFRQALNDPFYATPEVILANAGACATRAGKTEEAEEFLREALSIDPNNELALYHMANLSYQQGDAFRARAFYQRLEAVAQPEPGSLMLGYRIESALGSSREAEQYADRLLSEFSDSPEAARLRQERYNDD